MSTFIVFEGIDGSGKTTQAQLFKRELELRGLKTNYFREPGGTDLGESIREIALNKEASPRAELLLFLASRAELVSTKVLPKLNIGEIVILDRYVDSSVVYQGGIRDIGYKNVFNACMFATNHTMPSFTYYIDVHPEIAFERISNKKADKFESQGIELLKEARRHYLQWYKYSPHKAIIIDGNDDINKVNLQILDHYLHHAILFNEFEATNSAKSIGFNQET